MKQMVSKSKLTAIRQDVEAALMAVAKAHNLDSMKLGNMIYDADGFKVPLVVRFAGGESVELKTLRVNAALMGFEDAIVGATITYANRQCVVLGMKRTKFLLQVDGKECTANITDVKRVLEKQGSPLIKKDSLVITH